MSKLQLVQYSEKAIAVFGETKPYINELKELGGKFNPSLTHENEKKPGWIYAKKSEEKLKELVSKINAGLVKPSEVVASKSYGGEKPTVDIKVFMALVSRVERLEQELQLLQSKMGITSRGKNEVTESVSDSGSYSDVEEEEELQVSKPRLIKKK